MSKRLNQGQILWRCVCVCEGETRHPFEVLWNEFHPAGCDSLSQGSAWAFNNTNYNSIGSNDEHLWYTPTSVCCVIIIFIIVIL